MKYGKFKKSDIWSIVQIFDTDGTYIPNSAIQYGENEGFQYTTTNILAKKLKSVEIRNSRKSKLMNHLRALDSIEDIPYKGYYFSCNLDHALYNIQNLSTEEKEEYADLFYSRFAGKEKSFIDFLEIDVVNGVPNRYAESWRYISDGVHSLERHTNLHIYFLQNPL